MESATPSDTTNTIQLLDFTTDLKLHCSISNSYPVTLSSNVLGPQNIQVVLLKKRVRYTLTPSTLSNHVLAAILMRNTASPRRYWSLVTRKRIGRIIRFINHTKKT